MNLSRKRLSGVLIATVLATVLLAVPITYVLAQSGTTFTITSGIYPGSPNYTYFYESGTLYRKTDYGLISTITDFDSSLISTITDNVSILLKAGTYSVDATIIKAANNVIIEGEGRATVIRLASSTNINIFNLTSVSGWTIKNLAIDGNKAGQAWQGNFDGQNGIWLGSTNIASGAVTNSVFEGLYLHDVIGSGIAVRGSSTENIKILNNVFADIPRNGIVVMDSMDVLIDGNTLYDVGSIVDSDNKWHGIYTYGDNHIITNNIVKRSDGDGITTYGGWNITVANNVVLDSGRIGIYVTNAAPNKESHIVVDGNTVINTGLNPTNPWGWKEGIKASGSHIVVSNNIVSGVPTVGIYMTVAEYSVVSGNIVKNGTGTAGITIHQSDYSTVSGNMVSFEVAIGININDNDYITVVGNSAVGNLRGINLDTANYNLVSGNSANGNGNYGIIEWTATNYNTFVGNTAFNNPTSNITTIGANSKVASSYNGTTWIT